MTDESWRESLALAHAARRSDQPEQALAHYQRAVSLAPDSVETNSTYGLMLLHLGRIDEAAAALKRAVDIDPSHPAARMNLAELYARQNDIPAAIGIVTALSTEIPQSWWVWNKLGELNVLANEFSEAAAHFHQAVERKRNDASLLYKWAKATFYAGSTTDARVILDEAAQLDPRNGAILGLYAEILERGADWGNLERIAEIWSHAEPQNPMPWKFAAKALWETGYLKQAMASFRTFLDRGGRSATNLATFARLCLAGFAYDDAARALDEAEQLEPECGTMLAAKATLSMLHGEFPDSLRYARRAIAANPRDTAAFKVLVQVSRGRITEDEQAALLRLSEDRDLRPAEQIPASFALADCLDAQGDFDAAFLAYQRGNDLGAERARKERIGYDRAERKRQIDRLLSMFPTAPRSDQAGVPPQPVPIFIVGMPRSGTTLVESILGAHSSVLACGERQEMRTIMQEFTSLSPNSGMAGIGEATRQRWREAFWRELPDLRGATAVIDKNPWNCDALGVIFELFPHARVVHVRRDPVETGLSIFRNEFPKFASFTNRLEDIGHCFGEYARLMAHWKAILGDRFMTIRYEDLVADFSNVAPGLLRFCGLEWEDACRDFTKSARIISTLSAVQARQPLASFKARSGKYARHLSPLIAALREAGVELQSRA